MNIVLVGGSQVGQEIARSLLSKNYDVTVIEQDEKKAAELQENLNLTVIQGSGVDYNVLVKAGVRSADMVIAATGMDEDNVNTCKTARKMGVKIAAAVVKDQKFSEQDFLLDRGKEQPHEDLPIHIISLARTAAVAISRMIHFPEAIDIELLGKGKVLMFSLEAAGTEKIANIPLKELPPPQVGVVVGIKKPSGNFIIPSGKTVIRAGDRVYVLGHRNVMREISWLFHSKETRTKRVLILGGGATSLHLAADLESVEQRSFQVKIIEKSKDRCAELSQILKTTTLIAGDGTNQSYLNEKELNETDILVAITGDDLVNLEALELAKNIGVKNLISKVCDVRFEDNYRQAGVEKIINAQKAVASQVHRLIRWEDIISLTPLKGKQAEVAEIVLPASSSLVGTKLEKAGFPRGMIIGSILRRGELIIPSGQTVLQVNDRMVIFALPGTGSLLKRLFTPSY